MKRFILFFLLPACATVRAQHPDANPFRFSNANARSGLFPALDSIYGHGVAWGDVNGDGLPDLYVGTFHKNGSKPNMFFLNKGNGVFQMDTQETLRLSSRTTGIVFADFDNDGDLDLYVSSMSQHPGHDYKYPILGCTLYRNDGNGKFTDISEGNGACPKEFGGRSVSVFDYDGDGLLDLLVGEEWHTGYSGSETKSSRIFHNLGNLRFEDVSRSVGLPSDIPGYGTAEADLNNDGWPDFFIASNDGGDVMFLNDGHGKFREVRSSRKQFAWLMTGAANMVCGVAFGDLNRDGLEDMVLGPHFLEPWLDRETPRVFLNTGIRDGIPTFREITAEIGMVPLAIKSPHVEIQDFDNDGWPDIYASVVKFRDGIPYPLIYHNPGITKKMMPFKAYALDVNDFPNASDTSFDRGHSKQFFDHIFEEGSVMYTAPGPTGDYDNDGRLDLFMASFWPEKPSLLIHNDTRGGNWLEVMVEGSKGVNRMGIGSKVKIYRAGSGFAPAGLLGYHEISVGYGYASGHQAMAHFGLGKEKTVDVEITLPYGKGSARYNNIKANQRITLH